MKSPELKDRLEESEKLIQEMTVTWEEKLRKTEEIAQVCISLTAEKNTHHFLWLSLDNGCQDSSLYFVGK